MRKRHNDLLISITPVTNCVTAEPGGALLRVRGELPQADAQLVIINQRYPRKNIVSANFLEKYEVYKKLYKVKNFERNRSHKNIEENAEKRFIKTLQKDCASCIYIFF